MAPLLGTVSGGMHFQYASSLGLRKWRSFKSESRRVAAYNIPHVSLYTSDIRYFKAATRLDSRATRSTVDSISVASQLHASSGHSRVEATTNASRSRLLVAASQRNAATDKLHGTPFAQLATAIEESWNLLPHVSRVDVPSEFSSVTLEDEASELQIDNTILETPHFRKLHLEVARSDTGLQVVHCVMFPRAEFDLPLFSLDMVGFGDRITLLILDLCPITPDLTLPAAYGPALESLQRELLAEVPTRGTPDWGKAIFSEHCVLLSPSTSEHVANFIEYVRATLAMHLQHSMSIQPDKDLRAQNCAGQRRFCEFQLKNDKTRRILAKSKGEDWANRYMDNILFDVHNIQ